MFDGAPRFRFSSFELSLAAPHDLRFRGGQGVIGVNRAFRRYKHTVLFLGERDNVTRLELESFEDLLGNNHLPALSDAGGSLLRWGRFHIEYYS
jgi:hypothetical protein